jgi:hypothetical protein
MVCYKPTYDVRSYAELLALLKQFERDGLGGVKLKDLKESYIDVEKDVKRLQEDNLVFVIGDDPKKGPVLFYHNPEYDLAVDPDLAVKWREVSVDKPLKFFEDELRKDKVMPLRVELQQWQAEVKMIRPGSKAAGHASLWLMNAQMEADADGAAQGLSRGANG